MEYYIIVYKNTHDAMDGEKKLIENEFKFRIMPTPTSITQSCGICARFDEKKSIEKVITEQIVNYKNIYCRNSEGFILIK